MAKKAAAKSEPKPAKAKKVETATKQKAEKQVVAKAEKPKAVKADKPKKAAKIEVEADVIEEVAATIEVEVESTDSAPEKKVKVKAKSAKSKRIAAEQALAASEANKKWLDLKDKHGSEKAPSYSMSGTFDLNSPIQHKTFGWGFVVKNENNRMEVLFETGTRQLISNYKP